MRLSKRKLAKCIFIDATQGLRKMENYPDGRFLMDMISQKCTADYIHAVNAQLRNGEIDAESALARLTDMAYENSCGKKGPTQTSNEILKAYHKFR